MVNAEILSGLKAALERGQTLRAAMMSFYNAGYAKEEIEEAARSLMQTGTQQTQVQTQAKPEAQPIQKPQPVQQQKQPPQTVQQPKVSLQPKPQLQTQMQLQKQIAMPMQVPLFQKKETKLPIFQKPKEQKIVQKVSSYDTNIKPKKNNAMIIVLILILIVLFGMLAGIFFFKQQLIDWLSTMF